jgi:hypothetical protein
MDMPSLKSTPLGMPGGSRSVLDRVLAGFALVGAAATGVFLLLGAVYMIGVVLGGGW